MCQNLGKAWRRWGVIDRVLVKTGATVWSGGMIYEAVDHSVLLYRIEISVVTGYMLISWRGYTNERLGGSWR